MITLGGVTISDNMVLLGVEQANSVTTEQIRAADGTPYVKLYDSPGGRALQLGTSQIGKIQGIWYQSVLDELRAVQDLKTPVVLNYNGEVFTVYITDFSSIEPLFQNEKRGPCKRYIGLIDLIEA